jgi:superfamily II RNA helicase
LKIKMPEMPPATLLTALGHYNLLPAIVFMPTRRRCDQAASEAAYARRDPNLERSERRREFMREFVAEHPEVRGHRHWNTIIRGAVASHHAGHIPAWKLVIEKLMSAGLLDTIFATATVAAGVDFPARTVVLTGADARTGSGWRMLTASELQQMTGRAGRRGKDNVGFVVAAPGLHQDPETIAKLLKAKPDPLVSQFRATYTTLLNLLDAYGSFTPVREIAEKSFAHRESAQAITRLEKQKSDSREQIGLRLIEAGCDLSPAVALGLERLLSARERLQETQPQSRAELLRNWLDKVVQPGRIVGIGRSGRRLVLVTQRNDGQVIGLREDGRRASFPLERIGPVYATSHRARDEDIEAGFAQVRSNGKSLLLPEPRLRDSRSEDADALELIDKQIETIVPEADGPGKVCREALWSTLADAEAFERAQRQIESLRDEVWRPFEQKARVLAEFGYLDFEREQVTDRGRWLADLHVDRPLLIGEALKEGLFASLDKIRLAAVMAALTSDEDRDYGELELDDPVVETLAQFEDVGFKVSTEEWKYGVEPAPEPNFSAAATAAHWAAGVEWSALVLETRAEEGDLVRMLSRTGEALLQVGRLARVYPQVAHMAVTTAEIILREPVR